MTTIASFPTPIPTRGQTQDVFDPAMSAFLAHLPDFVSQANQVALEIGAAATNATSTSSVAIGTGAATFTVQTGLSYQVGMSLMIAVTASPTVNAMVATVTSYSGSTLVVNVQDVIGSGTYAAWSISQTLSQQSMLAYMTSLAVLKTSQTGSAQLPVGTTAQRDGTPADGYFRFNSTLNTLESWYSSAWNALATTANAVLTSGNQTIAGVKTFSSPVGVAAAVASGDAAQIGQLRGYIDGLTMSTAGSSATMTVGAGVAMDSTNAVMMTLAASISKTTSAWAVGTAAGGLDTGAIAANTWYRRYLIRRPDTGVVDLVFSTNFTTPSLPANYTQYRAIGFIKTDDLSNWTDVLQDGDWNKLDTQSTSDASFSGVGSSLITLPTPVGVRLKIKVSGYITGNATAAILITDPAQTDSGASNKRITSMVPATAAYTAFLEEVFTDTSARVRVNSNDASISGGVAVVGWYDPRGRE